jgi:PAS domain S-box-containing protein
VTVTRHLFVVVLSALLPLLLVAVVLAIILVRGEREATERALRESAQRLAQALDAEFQRSYAALEGLARGDTLRRGDLKTFYREATELRDRLELWDNVLLLSPRADHLLNLRRPYGEVLPPVPQPEGTLTAAATKKPYVSGALKGRVETEWLMYIAYPVIHDGEVRYVIGATMNYRYWTRWLAANASSGTAAGLIDGNGVLLARTQDPERVVGQPVQPWYRDLIAGSASGFSRGQGVTDSDVVVAFHRAALSGWTVNVFTSGAVLDAPMRKTALWVSLAVSAALLIAAGLAMRRARVIEQGQRASDALLRRSEERFRSIAHAMPAIVWVAGGSGLVFTNQRWEELTGQPAEQALGRGWLECVHPEDRVRLAPQAVRSRATGEPYEGEIRYRVRDGGYRWHTFRALPGPGEQGPGAQWVGCAVDIHEAREAQQALREADRRKDEFLATLAHELRNPLAPIVNSLHLLKMPGADAPMVQQARDIMERQVQHLVRLVDDLLDVQRVVSGKIELRKEAVDLLSVVTRAVETAQPLIDARQHRLELKSIDKDLLVNGDPVRLVQVVGNLLTNAARYTEPGGHIIVSASTDSEQAVLRIEDNGIGIPDHVLPHVFEAFVQGDQRATRAVGGLGIGLTLVKSLVELHGGKVEIGGKADGAGTRVTVRLPLARPAEAQDLDPGASGAVAAPAGPQRILVVDDNRDAADSLAALLRMQAHDVQVAYDGASALDAAKGRLPGFVFLDIGMPGMDGYETARRLRSMPGMQRAVIVALTGWGQAQDRHRSTMAGFDRHLVKPPDPDAVRRILST